MWMRGPFALEMWEHVISITGLDEIEGGCAWLHRQAR